MTYYFVGFGVKNIHYSEVALRIPVRRVRMYSNRRFLDPKSSARTLGLLFRA